MKNKNNTIKWPKN